MQSRRTPIGGVKHTVTEAEDPLLYALEEQEHVIATAVIGCRDYGEAWTRCHTALIGLDRRRETRQQRISRASKPRRTGTRSRGTGSRPHARSRTTRASSASSDDPGPPGPGDSAAQIVPAQGRTRRPDPRQWKFGHGQTAAQEGAEIAAAQAAGLTAEYTAAQEQQIRGGRHRRAHRAHAPVRTADACPLVSCPTGTRGAGEEAEIENEMRALLANVPDDAAPAELPPLPPDATGAMRKVASLAALVIGLHDYSGRTGWAMLSVRFVAEFTGLPRMTAWRALRSLVEQGVLDQRGSMPALGGREHGTGLYAAGSVNDAGDDVAEVDRDTSFDRSEDLPVDGDLVVDPAVEFAQLFPAGAHGVEVLVEAPPEVEDHPIVEKAVGHGRSPYAALRPTSASLVARALDRAQVGTRNETGLWLACQLRDNGHDLGTALEALDAYQRDAPLGGHPYTLREAQASVMSAYRRPPREPWGTPQGAENPAITTLQPGGSPGRMDPSRSRGRAVGAAARMAHEEATT